MCKKIMALLTALVWALGCVSALSENTKHERVYVVSDAEGNVQSLTDVIRLENTDGLPELQDRSMLEGIVNVGGDEAFTRDGESLTWLANGNDIVYQGTSGQAPAILPLVTLTLDGEKVTAEALKNKVGEATLTVSYSYSGALPALALTVLPLPAEGVSGLQMENCAALTEMGQQILIGWAVPGLSSDWLLPASFTVSFHADHADLAWMMTLVTADPVDIACRTLDSALPKGLLPRQILEDTITALTALQNGEAVPALRGFAQIAALKINELNSGLAQLNDGAVQLKDGTKQLKDGAAQLKTGTMLALVGASTVDESLKTLQKKNEEMNAGASRMADAVLSAANAQLAAAGLDTAELTLENYAETLDAALSQLPEDAEAARAAVSSVREQLDQAKSFLAGVQDYTGGVERAAVASASLKSGLKQIDDGVKALSDGTKQLSDGASALQQDGTQKLKDTLLNAEKTIAQMLLPYLQNQASRALDLYDAILGQTGASGYDLRPADMNAITVYLIRTDLQ